VRHRRDTKEGGGAPELLLVGKRASSGDVKKGSRKPAQWGRAIGKGGKDSTARGKSFGSRQKKGLSRQAPDAPKKPFHQNDFHLDGKKKKREARGEAHYCDLHLSSLGKRGLLARAADSWKCEKGCDPRALKGMILSSGGCCARKGGSHSAAVFNRRGRRGKKQRSQTRKVLRLVREKKKRGSPNDLLPGKKVWEKKKIGFRLKGGEVV